MFFTSFGMTIQLRLAFLGDAGVGKTSMAKRLAGEDFTDEYRPTIGTGEFQIKFRVAQRPVILTVIDISGSGVPDAGILRRMDGAVLICDLTNPQSLQNIEEKWFPEFQQSRDEGNGQCFVAVIGNKHDVKNLRKISLDQLHMVAEKVGAPEPELTSARNDVNIEKEVRRWIRRVLEARGIRENEEEDDAFQIDETTALINSDKDT